jgi:hypothetical protein
MIITNRLWGPPPRRVIQTSDGKWVTDGTFVVRRNLLTRLPSSKRDIHHVITPERLQASIKQFGENRCGAMAVQPERDITWGMVGDQRVAKITTPSGPCFFNSVKLEAMLELCEGSDSFWMYHDEARPEHHGYLVWRWRTNRNPGVLAMRALLLGAAIATEAWRFGDHGE